MDWNSRLEWLRNIPSYKKPDILSGLRLDSNENLAIDGQDQSKLLQRACQRTDVRMYPLDGTERLIGALSVYLGVPTNMISMGDGSDQILDMLLSNMAGHDARILTTDPTFTLIVNRCNLYGISLTQVPYTDSMTLDTEAILAQSGESDILYLDSPNNPTGYQMPINHLRRIVESFEGPIILDEAYADFAPYSAYSMVDSAPNLVVVRTLSKSFGLAGLRVGYMIANPDITEPFSRAVQYPYPISSVSIESAILALENPRVAEDSWDTVRRERQRIIRALREHDVFTVFESAANFVLFDAGGAYRRIHKALWEQGISVRMLGSVGSATGCLRVTVGSRDVNSRFLTAVRDLLK